MGLDKNGNIPDVPTYYARMINANVDLLRDRWQCCPFHTEKSPSFSYDIRTGRWRCFGACHTGGDVYDLHKMHYHLRDREEAVRSLNVLCGVVEKKELKVAYNDYKVNDDKVADEAAYQKCLLYADCPERWLELDYVMSKVPVDINELRELLTEWRVPMEEVDGCKE